MLAEALKDEFQIEWYCRRDPCKYRQHSTKSQGVPKSAPFITFGRLCFIHTLENTVLHIRHFRIHNSTLTNDLFVPFPAFSARVFGPQHYPRGYGRDQANEYVCQDNAVAQRVPRPISTTILVLKVHVNTCRGRYWMRAHGIRSHCSIQISPSDKVGIWLYQHLYEVWIHTTQSRFPILHPVYTSPQRWMLPKHYILLWSPYAGKIDASHWRCIGNGGINSPSRTCQEMCDSCRHIWKYLRRRHINSKIRQSGVPRCQ